MDTRSNLKQFESDLKRYSGSFREKSFEEKKLQQKVEHFLSEVGNLTETDIAAVASGYRCAVSEGILQAVERLQDYTKGVSLWESAVATLEQKASVLDSAFAAAESIAEKKKGWHEALTRLDKEHQETVDEQALEAQKAFSELEAKLTEQENSHRAAMESHNKSVETYMQDRTYKNTLNERRHGDYRATLLRDVREKIAQERQRFETGLAEALEAAKQEEAEVIKVQEELEKLQKSVSQSSLDAKEAAAYASEKEAQDRRLELATAESEAEIAKLDSELGRINLSLSVQAQEVSALEALLREQMAHKAEMAAKVTGGRVVQ